MDDLDQLLRDAASADGMTRIEFRDRIATFGSSAVHRLEEWLADPRLAAFAVRTIERAAAMPGAAPAAWAALARADATGVLKADINEALARLSGRARTSTKPNSGRVPTGGRRDGGNPPSAPRIHPAGPPAVEPSPEDEEAVEFFRRRRFEEAMLEVYEVAKREAGYPANRFLQKLRRDGGLETARYFLRQPGVSKGFIGLRDAARLDVTVEYLILRPEYAPLFSNAERAVARRRLLDHGLTPDQLPREAQADPG